MVLFGADRVAEFAHLFAGRTALLTGPSGRTSGNEPTFEALKRCCDLRLLLAPEHGVFAATSPPERYSPTRWTRTPA